MRTSQHPHLGAIAACTGVVSQFSLLQRAVVGKSVVIGANIYRSRSVGAGGSPGGAATRPDG